MISIHKLSKKYKTKYAVDNLTLDIHAGVITGFLGPNGAGKSTTMRMILGLIAPTKGDVIIDGKAYNQLECPISKIGALIEADAVNPKLTARQHLQLIATASGMSDSRISELLSLTGLESAANQSIGEFSLGMRQRLGIAGALLGDPETLILDEPFNGLDVDGINWLRRLTKELAGKGKAILISSHLMSEVQEIAERVIVLAKGKLIADMDMNEMSEKSMSTYVRVKSSNPQQLKSVLESKGAGVQTTDNNYLHVRNIGMEQIGDMALKNNIAIYELTKYQPSLEQLFKELTKGKAEYSSFMSLDESEEEN